MSSFKNIIERRVIGKNVIITTPNHHRIFSLREWNLYGYKAREIAHTHEDEEIAISLATILQ